VSLGYSSRLEQAHIRTQQTAAHLEKRRHRHPELLAFFGAGSSMKASKSFQRRRLKQAEDGSAVAEVCRKAGIRAQIFRDAR
jgi:hypothetical protein